MVYILEAQRFVDLNERKDLNGVFQHMGYVNKLFRSKNSACAYYDSHNKMRMRSLNAHGTWISDWHPETRLRYRVRKYAGETLSLPPLDFS